VYVVIPILIMFFLTSAAAFRGTPKRFAGTRLESRVTQLRNED
jgi:hypothetical protein